MPFLLTIDYSATYTKTDTDASTINLTMTSADKSMSNTAYNINKIQQIADLQNLISSFQAQRDTLTNQITFLTNLITTIQS